MEPNVSLLCSKELATGPHPESDEYNSQSISLRSIFILSSHLCLGLPSILLPSGFPTKIVYALVPWY